MSFHVYLKSLCNSVFSLNKNIQSVAVINNPGRTMEKISRSQFTKQYTDHLNELSCMSYALHVSMGRKIADLIKKYRE